MTPFSLSIGSIIEYHPIISTYDPSMRISLDYLGFSMNSPSTTSKEKGITRLVPYPNQDFYCPHVRGNYCKLTSIPSMNMIWVIYLCNPIQGVKIYGIVGLSHFYQPYVILSNLISYIISYRGRSKL